MLTPLVLEIFTPFIQQNGFELLHGGGKDFDLLFLVNEKCIIRFLYDRGFVACDFISPEDKLKLIATKDPETWKGYLVYPVYAVWKLLYSKDEIDAEYSPWQAPEKQLLFKKELLTTRLTNVVNGDYSRVNRFSCSSN